MAHVKFLYHLNGITCLFGLFMAYCYYGEAPFWGFVWGSFFCGLAAWFLKSIVIPEITGDDK